MFRDKNIFNAKFDREKYKNSSDVDNPSKIAEIFVRHMSNENYLFDYSLRSLEFEIDRFLSKHNYKSGKNRIYDKIFKNRYLKRHKIETYLTAYIGETLIKLYGGKWIGSFYGPENPFGCNFYTSNIIVKKFEFNPNHFIAYYLTNGKKEEGTFYEYLYSRNQSEGIFHDFLGGGLIKKIENSE